MLENERKGCTARYLQENLWPLHLRSNCICNNECLSMANIEPWTNGSRVPSWVAEQKSQSNKWSFRAGWARLPFLQCPHWWDHWYCNVDPQKTTTALGIVLSLVALQSSFFLLSVSLAEVLSHGGPQNKINLKQSLQGKLQSGEETGASGKAVCWAQENKTPGSPEHRHKQSSVANWQPPKRTDRLNTLQ